MTTKNAYHTPVLANAAIEGLSVSNSGVFVDATFGGGGHSRLILEKLIDGKLIAFDQDIEAGANKPDDDRVLFLNHNFRFLKNFLKLYGLIPVDGILADLGVSSYQFDVADRGFSTRFDGPLDMRMDKSAGLTASAIINEFSPERLTQIFKNYGELPNAKLLANAVARQRTAERIETTGQLKDLLSRYSKPGRENKFMAKVFQALRIEVNNELEALRELLQQSTEVLKPGGRLVVISYHSLEDRMVKNFIRSGNFEGILEKDFFGNPITPLVPVGKKIMANQVEIERNSRARSAVLRVAEKRFG